MKNHIIYIAIFSNVLLFNFNVYSKEIITFVTGEYPPYVSEKLNNFGFYSEIIMAVCKEADIDCKIDFYPWVRAEKLVESGTVFAAFPYRFNPERRKKYFLSEAIFCGRSKLFYYKESNNRKDFKFDKISDLNKYTIGFLRGASYKNVLERNNINFEESNDDNSLLWKLKSGRIDVAIAEELVFENSIKENFNKEIINFKSLINDFEEKNNNGLIVSKQFKNSEIILKKFNNSLKKIKKNGVYNKIIGNKLIKYCN